MQDQKRTTIRDIAEVLKLSVSTVSRALQDHPRISQETIAAVKSAAETMDYYVHGPAAALRKGHGNNIGVIVPRIDRQLFSNIIGGIEQENAAQVRRSTVPASARHSRALTAGPVQR